MPGPFAIAAIILGATALTAGIISWLSPDVPESQSDPGADIEAGGQNAPLPVVYGLRRVKGIRVLAKTGGADNKYLWMAFALCEGEIEAVEQVWIDGEPITAYDHVFASGHTASQPGADRLAVVHWYRGTDVQTSSSLLTAAPGWTANHRLRGVAYLACRFRYSRDVFRSAPRVDALVRGRKIHDPRSGATAWSDNAALIVRDYALNARFGRGLPVASWDDVACAAAANDCDDAEGYAERVSLGSPSSAVTLGGNRQRLVWLGDVPSNVRALAGATIFDGDRAVNDTKAARVLSVDRVETETELSGETGDEIGERWRWQHLAQTERRTEVLIERIDVDGSLSPAFSSSDTVYLAAAGRYEINVVLDTSQPVLDNLRRLLRGCRGMLPWIGGKYTLIIERDRPPAMDIGPDQIVGHGIDVTGPKLRNITNRIVAKYTSPERGWKPDSVIWPTPGSATETAMLAQDGQRLETNLDLPTVTSRAQAADLARIVALRTRGALRSRFVALPECLVVTPGDIVRLTDATLGWTNKPQLVLGITEKTDGELVFECVDHDAQVYSWENFDPALLHLDTDHPNPLIVSAPTALAVEVVLDRVRKNPDDAASPVIAVLIGAVVSWTLPADASAARIEVAYRSTAAGAAGWSLRAVPAGAASVDLLPLRHGETYEFRARALNAYGAASPWTGLVTQEIDKDVTAPATPTNLTVVGGAGLLAISWTPPTSVGFSHVEGELRRFAADGITVAETVSGVHYGDSQTLSGLAAVTKYAVRLRSVDDAGNKSGWTGWVEATTADVTDGGEDGEEGVGIEYIFTSKANANPVTGSANLPLASQNYDVDALRTAGGVVRGTQKYFDGTPADLDDDRPYQIRFRRPVPGQPDQNEDIGAVPWVQERALRVAGLDRPTIEFIYIRKDDPNAPNRVTTTAAQDGTDGYLPANTTNDPVGVTSSLRYEFEARRRRASSAAAWGKFSEWRRVESYIDPDTGETQPAVFNGSGPPSQSMGLDNDTYVEISGVIRLSVWKKLDGAWVRVSDNPDDAAWTTGAGKPAASASNGSYYGDNSSGNVWVRHGGAWHWAIDLDPSGEVKWRFGLAAPPNGLGSNGDRYYRWSNGVWYERSSGSYTARGDLTTGYDTSRPTTVRPPVNLRVEVEGTSFTVSWERNPLITYDRQGRPMILTYWCGAFKKSTENWGGSEAIVSPQQSLFTFTDLEPNTTYNVRVCARYRRIDDPASIAAHLLSISSYVTINFTTGTRILAANSTSGDAGTFVNTSGTDNRVEIAGNSYPVTVRSGTAMTEQLRIEEGGDVVSQGEFVGDNMAATSDRRLKSNLVRLDRAADKIELLSGYTFDKKGRRQAGLIAQDVEKVLPEAVSEKGGYKTLSPSAVQALLVEAIKELREEIRGLASKR